jgi:hypothetical protein
MTHSRRIDRIYRKEGNMNRFKWILWSTLIAGLFFFPLAAIAQQQPTTPAPAAPQQPPMAAPAKPQQPPMAAVAKPAGLSGKITAIDMAANTVVVEVPRGKQMFTLGGPLAPKAKLTKGGKSAKLANFKQGDQVIVSYKSTPKGPVIQSLAAK